MGYDLLIAELVIPVGEQPNWDAVRRTIDRLEAHQLDRSLGWQWDPLLDWLPEWPECTESEIAAAMPTVRETLRADLDAVRAAYANPAAHGCLAMDAEGQRIFLAGGATAGEDPTELWGSLLNLADTGLLFEAGFTQLLHVPRAEFEGDR